MNKGLIFSMDAAYAILAVVLISSIFAVYFQATESSTEEQKVLDITVEGKAESAFLTGNTDHGMPTRLSGDRRAGICKKIYRYSGPDNGSAQGQVAAINYCEEIT